MRRREFLTDSGKQLERLKWIVDSLLHLTRFDAELAELQFEPVDVEELLAEVLLPFHARITAKRISLKQNRISAHQVINCDRARMLLALANLLDNAVKYTPPKGAIEISLFDSEDSLAIRIEDSGPGIDFGEQKAIFRRFYRSDRADGQGSGLGLPLAKSIVEAHGGKIEVSSNSPQGACFTLFFPVERTT